MIPRKIPLALSVTLAALATLSCKRAESPRSVSQLPTITSSSGVELVLVPAGYFEMGSRQGKEDEKPVHKVWLDSFLIDRHEVTQAEYEKLGKVETFPNPSHFKGPDLPVEQVTWPQAARFCNARSRLEGLKPCYNEDSGACDFAADGYRLPTEAEWEYACRAAIDRDYSFGSDPRQLPDFAWYADNSAKKTHPVGQKKPNAWGLQDMHGNVAEWC
jgi:formylglycine-generating enzyme required for sulfatase activity